VKAPGRVGRGGSEKNLGKQRGPKGEEIRESISFKFVGGDSKKRNGGT